MANSERSAAQVGKYVRAIRRSDGGFEYGKLTADSKGCLNVNGVAVRRRGIQILTGNDRRLAKVFLKTRGHCHFCGDEIVFEKRGWDRDLAGRWEVDHVIQRKKKGGSSIDNYLPACTRCNRLRWSRTGASLRRVIFLGLVAKDEAYYNPGSDLGAELRRLRIERLAENLRRRMKKSLKPAAYRDFIDRLPSIIKNAGRFEDLALKRYQSALKTKRGGKAEITAVQLSAGKPSKAHVSWTKSVDAVRRDPRTPSRYKAAEAILRE